MGPGFIIHIYPSIRVPYRILHPHTLADGSRRHGGLVYHPHFGRNGPRRDDNINHIIQAEEREATALSLSWDGTGRGGLPTTEYDKVGNQKTASTKYLRVADHCEARNRKLGTIMKLRNVFRFPRDIAI